MFDVGHLLTILLDSQPRRQQSQPARRSYRSRPRAGQFWVEDHRDLAASVEGGRVRLRGDL